VIELDNVSKTYGSGVVAVRGVSLSVTEGELVVLLGESGCGKTTTLKMINRLTEPGGGRDVRDGDPGGLRRRIGYVFQGIGLFPHCTVAENVATVPELLGWPPKEIGRRVAELLSDAGLPPDKYAARYPAELSGGQRQRIGVARALAARPRVLLMDEPFGALDPLTRDELREQFRALQRRLGLTVLLVTHDMTEAVLLADRIAVMQDGRIAGVGTPAALIAQPPNDYVERLLAMPRRQADAVEKMIGAKR